MQICLFPNTLIFFFLRLGVFIVSLPFFTGNCSLRRALYFTWVSTRLRSPAATFLSSTHVPGPRLIYNFRAATIFPNLYLFASPRFRKDPPPFCIFHWAVMVASPGTYPARSWATRTFPAPFCRGYFLELCAGNARLK